MNNIKLYKKDSAGKIRVWSVEADYANECLIIEHGVLGGEIVTKEEFIDEGKAGRDIDEQLDSRLQSRANKKMDLGYVDSIEKANGPLRNAIGFLMPMKAQPTVDKHLRVKEKLINQVDWSNAFVQRKYNGLRCLITQTEDGLVAYTRGGKYITTISHILDGMILPLNATIDGELYCHGTPLQTINSWAKRKQPNTSKLKLLAYDMISASEFGARFSNLKELNALGPGVEIAETILVNSYKEAIGYFHQFRNEGYEGAILRHGIAGYEDGKRSKSVLKIKGWHDSEFVVVDITESKDGIAVLHMMTENGSQFKATAPGTYTEKKSVLRNKGEYIGLSVTIRFAELTNDGLPAQPVAVAWREKGE